MSIDTVIVDTIDRGFESKSQEIQSIESLASVSQNTNQNLDYQGGGGPGASSPPLTGGTTSPTRITQPSKYIEFGLYSSNNKLIFTRKYTKLVDVFANIGGVSEVLGFVVIFCYSWYNAIRMEERLLNYGVLNKSQDRTEAERRTGKGNDNTDEEKENFFTFWELVKLGLMEKGLGCCYKDEKSLKRKALYNKIKQSKETRTDVINIMKSVADIDTLKEALLSPYQQRLIHYLATMKDDDQTNEQEMAIIDAIRQLKAPKGNEQSSLQKDFDHYLLAHLPEHIMRGFTRTHADSKFRPNSVNVNQDMHEVPDISSIFMDYEENPRLRANGVSSMSMPRIVFPPSHQKPAILNSEFNPELNLLKGN